MKKLICITIALFFFLSGVVFAQKESSIPSPSSSFFVNYFFENINKFFTLGAVNTIAPETAKPTIKKQTTLTKKKTSALKSKIKKKKSLRQNSRQATPQRQKPTTDSLADQFAALETELQGVKMRNAGIAPDTIKQIEKKIAQLESSGYNKDKIVYLRQLLEELTSPRKDESLRTEALEPKQNEIKIPQEKQEERLSIAEPQPWVFDAVTQPVPPGASETRLVTLPAPHEKISLEHLGAFGAHVGGHPEGLDHEWINIEGGTPVGSWAPGTVIKVKLNNQNNPQGEWRIQIDYGGGLFGEHMDVKTPLVKVGDKVEAGQPVAYGLTVPWAPERHSGEFNLSDEHRRDGVQSWVRGNAVFVSPYDYLREDVKKEFIALFTKKVLEPLALKEEPLWGVKPWEPYLTNPVLFHKMYKGTLAGEWFLKSKKWAVDTTPDLIVLLTNNTKYYNKKKIIASESEGGDGFSGTWEADYAKNQFTFTTEDGGPHYGIGISYYGIFELDESGPRATLKIEYQRDSYPTGFSDKASTYTERDGVGRRQDGYNLGVQDTPY